MEDINDINAAKDGTEVICFAEARSIIVDALNTCQVIEASETLFPNSVLHKEFCVY